MITGAFVLFGPIMALMLLTLFGQVPPLPGIGFAVLGLALVSAGCAMFFDGKPMRVIQDWLDR